jgi:hypothetical protein
MPDWTVAERISYAIPGMPTAFGIGGLNIRGMFKSVEAMKGHVIMGGVKAKSPLQLNAAVVQSDVDGDGYTETCTVTIPITFTDPNQVHVYYAGEGADDSWEIRPIKVSISGGICTITFNSWQIPVAGAAEALDISPLDPTDAASYETVVDVYQVYNDPSMQLQFMWENIPFNLVYGPGCCCGDASCVACQLSTQYGCFHLRDERLGMVVPAPGNWNAGTGQFDQAEFYTCRDPDQIVLWYYSGYYDNSMARPFAEMSNYWKYAVAYYAASKFERSVCGCSNVNQFIEKWRRDAAFSSMQEGGWKLTAEQAGNKLGTTMGAFYAYRAVHRSGVRVIKA